MTDLKAWIAGKDFSIVFDGTTRLGEAIVLLARTVDDRLQIQQRLLSVRTTQQSVTGAQLAGLIIDVLSRSLDIPAGKSVVSSCRDRASVNNVACSTVKGVWPDMLDIPCFPHFLDTCGDKFDIKDALDFTRSFSRMFKKSHACRHAFKERAGVMPKRFVSCVYCCFHNQAALRMCHVNFTNWMLLSSTQGEQDPVVV